MKYVVPQEKLFEIIYNFIHSEFTDDDLDWEYDRDPDKEDELERNIINFYGLKYADGEQDEWTFQYVRKEYYENLEDESFKEKWIHKAPLLDLLHSEFSDKMNNLFGNYWQPVFKKWFNDVYPEFPVKTYIFNYDK